MIRCPVESDDIEHRPVSQEGSLKPMGQIISYIVVGLIVGVLARFFYPGPVPLGVIGTILLGIGGSFVGGFLSRLVGGGNSTGALQPAGIIGSIIGGMVLIFGVGLLT